MEHGGRDNRIELLNHAQKGDKAALNNLLKTLRPEVRSYLEGQLQSQPASAAQAEELTQQVLVRIARSVDTCQASSAGELWAWAKTIARNALTDRYRKRKRELERRTWSANASQFARATLQEVFDTTAEPTATNADAVLGAILLEAQAELSEGTQEVVRRQVMLNETWRDTGMAVGTTGPGAKRRWQRARPRLRREVLRRIRDLPPDLRKALLRRLGEEPAKSAEDE